jgi:predicted Zn-dependent peptidase
MLKAGSADELPGREGVAHFIEHLLFKGTTKRRSSKILSTIDAGGGELNAYTGKEETFVYATFLKSDYSRATDLLFDIVFNSIFPEKEIEKERMVILDELKSYEDEPAEDIYETFEELYFGNHPLAHSILGTKKSLNKISRNDLISFVETSYTAERVVFCSIADLPFEKVKDQVRRAIKDIQFRNGTAHRTEFRANTTFTKEVRKKTHTSHCIIGGPGYSRTDSRRTGLILLNNMLGGPALNSRLSVEVREKRGLSYTIETGHSAYESCGLWNIYFSCDGVNTNRVIDIIQKELRKLREEKLGTLQLERAKKQLRGQLIITKENPATWLNSIGKSYLSTGQVESPLTIINQIDNISSAFLSDVANECYNEELSSSLFYY